MAFKIFSTDPSDTILPQANNIQLSEDWVEVSQGVSGTSRRASLSQIWDAFQATVAAFLSDVSVAGVLSAASASITGALSAASASITGALSAASASITGALSAATASFTSVSATSVSSTTVSATTVDASRFTSTPSALTQASPTTVDFNGAAFRTLSLSGDITFATSNLAAGRSVTIKILSDGSTRNYTFPAWVFVGTEPTDIEANKTAVLSLTAFGNADSDVVAAYAVEA